MADHLLTLDEWDALPENSSRCYELVEGVLVVVPRPAPLHQRAMVRLATQLDNQLPDELTALADVEVLVDATDPATVRAPDVVVIRTELAEQNPSRLNASDVLLAVEIVSPGTRGTDRVTKLAEYAHSGIRHYWLVELDEPVKLTAYTLVGDDYEIIAQATDTATFAEPASITIDVRSLTTRR